jgi:hypothetical protein
MHTVFSESKSEGQKMKHFSNVQYADAMTAGLPDGFFSDQKSQLG